MSVTTKELSTGRISYLARNPALMRAVSLSLESEQLAIAPVHTGVPDGRVYDLHNAVTPDDTVADYMDKQGIPDFQRDVLLNAVESLLVQRESEELS